MHDLENYRNSKKDKNASGRKSSKYGALSVSYHTVIIIIIIIIMIMVITDKKSMEINTGKSSKFRSRYLSLQIPANGQSISFGSSAK